MKKFFDKSKPEIICLTERGTKKVHVFKAWKELVEAPKNRPVERIE